MKTWIKRSLIGLAATATLAGGLIAWGGHGHHARGGWSEERITEVRGKAIERISDRLTLNAAQQQKLDAVADELLASRQALRGGTADPRTELQALIGSEKFDRSRAQALLEQKTQVAQGQGPKLIAAFGDFYDSLTPEQQKQVREALDKRGRGGWGRG
jgi:Spy/CpxP family protein refolding chaperone